MQQRMNIATLLPNAFRAMAAFDQAVKESGIDPHLLHLVKLRASQINGCGYCVDMHVKESLADGMNPQMLHLVSVWRESRYFSAKQRAALEWTESLTLIAQTGAPDDAFAVVSAEFTETQIAQLTLLICAINSWNRIAISSRQSHPIP